MRLKGTLSPYDGSAFKEDKRSKRKKREREREKERERERIGDPSDAFGQGCNNRDREDRRVGHPGHTTERRKASFEYSRRLVKSTIWTGMRIWDEGMRKNHRKKRKTFE